MNILEIIGINSENDLYVKVEKEVSTIALKSKGIEWMEILSIGQIVNLFTNKYRVEEITVQKEEGSNYFIVTYDLKYLEYKAE